MVVQWSEWFGRRLPACLLAMALPFSLFFSGVPVAAEDKLAADLAIVAERLREYYLSVDFFGDGAIVEVCTVSRAGEYLASQQPDGSWADVDYYCTESAANGLPWSPYLALDRMQAMAVAYAKPGHPHYRDPAMLAGVEKALLHWKSIPGDPNTPGSEGPYSVNWWENSIGPQLRFGRIGLFLKDELSEEAKAVLTKKLQKEGDAGTGQNAFWFTQNALFRAIITDDPVQFQKVAALLNNKVAIQTGPDTQEAVQVDYSFHAHGELFMSNHYGMALFQDMSLWLYVLRGTSFAASPKTIQLMADYMLKGTRWTIRGNSLELALGYTPITDGAYAYHFYAEPIRRMMALDPANAAEYQILLDNITGKRKDNGLNGFHYMWTSAYASQMRPGYGVNVRMDSSTIKGPEWRATWPDTQYGNLLFWASAGAVTVVVDGDEYASVYPTFDWRHTPGTTAPFALATRYGHFIANDMAMGADSGDHGLTGFSYNKHDGMATTRGKIGYFFFDDEYVALGAGIYSNSKDPIHTTINQTKADAPVTSAGQVPLGTNGQAVTGRWAYNNKIGYVFFKDTQFQVSNLDHETLNLPTLWKGIYSQFSIDNLIPDGTYTTEDTFSLWIDHGVNPQGASYAYIVVPNTTAAETERYAQNIPITVLANNERVQAVRHETLKQTQINFYQPGAVLLDENTILIADAPCSVVMDQSGEVTRLSAGIPNNAANPYLTLTLKDSKGVTKTHFIFAPAPYTGQTITLTAGETGDCFASAGVAAHAFDGDSTTVVNLSAGGYVTRDFGSTVYVSRADIRWQGNGVGYRIEGSIDNHNWTVLYDTDTPNTTAALDASYRFVRFVPKAACAIQDIVFTSRTMDYELRTNLALNRPVTVSGTHSATSNLKEEAVDGNLKTRWAGNRSSNVWIYVDLGKVVDLDVVRIFWEAAYADDYTIDVSDDAANWTTAMTVTNSSGGTQQHVLPTGTKGRYLRIRSLKNHTQYGISIWELEVYSREDATTPDIMALQALYGTYHDMDLTGVDADTQRELTAALQGAETALVPPFDQAAVLAALNALQSAAAKVDLQLARMRLAELYDQAKSLTKGRYSDTAWHFFDTQRQAAAALLNNNNATALALNDQADILAAALQILEDDSQNDGPTKGDVNFDGAITATDARLTLQAAVNKITLTGDAAQAADVNRDGNITATDARLILQRAVNKIPEL